MTICLDGKFYDLYKLAFLLLVMLFVLYRYKTKEKIKTSLLLMLLFTMAFPVVFSIYSSYTRDFQPQGRYIMSMLPAICVFTSVGLDEFSKAVNKKFVPALSVICLLILLAVLYYTVMLPTLTFTYLPGAGSVQFYYIR